MKLLLLLGIIGAASLVFVISQIAESVAIGSQETQLKLHKFTSHRFDGGQPIVFSGNLFTDSGHRVPRAEIIIKHDGPCPADGIIAKGLTDSNGRFWILTTAKVWDTATNLVRIHAEYHGDENLLSSESKKQIVVVSPSLGNICEN